MIKLIHIYLKQKLSNEIELINSDIRCTAWLKIKKDYFGYDEDVLVYIYKCLCFFPSEGSRLYKSKSSHLCEFDLIEVLSANEQRYSDLRHVYCTDDYFF